MGGITHVQERTVRKDGSVRFDNDTYVGKSEYDRNLLRKLIGKKVFVQQANYWCTEIQAAEHRFLPGNLPTARLKLENTND